MINNEDRLYADFAANGIGYEVAEHQAVFTVEESSALHDQLSGAHSKNLFLKDAGGVFWLITVPADIRVDLKALPAAIGSKRVSFGKAEDMERLLGVTPGSVTPLAAFNDHEAIVQIVLDRHLIQAERVWVHPLRNTASLGIAGCDLVAALTGWSKAPLIVDVPQVVDAA